MVCRWLSSKPWDTHPVQDRRLSFVIVPALRIKVVVWDGTGVWLCQRRLHEGRFIWPKVTDPCFSVTFEQWQWLIAGVDWQRLSALPSTNWQV